MPVPFMSSKVTKPLLNPYLLATLIGTVSVLPFLVHGIPYGPDREFHLHTAHGLVESFNNFHFFPSLHFWGNEGYGDLSLRFYPPLLYFLFWLFTSLTGDWFWGTQVLFLSLSLVGALGMVQLLKFRVSPVGAFLGCLFFCFTAYRQNQIYQAALFGEFLAGSIFPWVFHFCETVLQNPTPKNTAKFGLALSLLFLSHLPLTILGGFSLAVYISLRCISGHFRQALLPLFFSLTGALLVTSFFWIKVVVELGWIRGETTPWYDYRLNFIFGQSVAGSPYEIVTYIFIATVLLFCPLFPFLDFKKNKWTASLNWVGLVLVFLMLPISQPVWQILPFFKSVQFPWRLLAILSFLLATGLATTISYWLEVFKGEKRWMVWATWGPALISITFTFSQIMRDAQYTPSSTFSQFERLSLSSWTPDSWFPVWASQPPPHKNGAQATLDGVPVSTQWTDPFKKTITVANPASSTLRLKLFFYPHWKIKDGKAQTLTTLPDRDGALVAFLKPGNHELTVTFQEPPYVIQSRWLSLFGIFFFLYLFFRRNSPRALVLPN